MRLRRVTDVDGLSEVYDVVLAPSFPAEELVSRAWLIDGVADGTVTAVGAYDGETLTAAAVTEVVCPDVVLLSYLAALPVSRGAGVGSALLTDVRAAAKEAGALLVLAEVERPDRHAGSAQHGDPAARLRFYARHGARVLDLPYVQPPMRPQDGPVRGMLLLALDVDPTIVRDGGSAVDGAIVRRAVDAILGDGPDDALAMALRAAAHVPLVGLRPAGEWESVADSG